VWDKKNEAGSRVWYYISKKSSGETNKKRGGSHPIYKNRKKKYFYRLDPPRGRPVGGGGVYLIWGYGGLNPHQ